MPRKLKGTWLHAYRDYILKQEAPDIFHFWVGLTLISSSLRRHVWVDRGAYRVYPNQYVILLAESASCRKSVAMNIGLDILKPNKEIRIVYERTTLEGLMDIMKGAWLSPSGKIKTDGSVTLHADELSNLFSKASYITDLVSFLTAIYTSPSGRKDFLTRNKGWCKVEDPCAVLLTGTTPEQLGEIFPVMTLASGFMGRVLLIVGTKGRRIAKPKLKDSLKQGLVDDLYHMGRLEGEVKVDDETEKIFCDWYEGMSGPESPELSAFYERKHDHVWKTAMLLSISESDNMIIRPQHFYDALNEINHVEENLPRAVAYIGATAKSTVEEVVLRIIRKNAPELISHSNLLRRMRRKVQDKDEFQSIIDTLSEARLIRTVPQGQAVYYGIRREEKE